MRGCFQSRSRQQWCPHILPAYARMFPDLSGKLVAHGRSPRVCGDVSGVQLRLLLVKLFSPRMRGCFRNDFASKGTRYVLPAYAGLFLFLKAWRQNYSGYSRAKEIIRHHAVYSACSLVILTIGTVMPQFRYTIQMVVYENKI